MWRCYWWFHLPATTQLRVKQRMSDYHQGSAAAQKMPGGRDRQEEFTHTVSVARER